MGFVLSFYVRAYNVDKLHISKLLLVLNASLSVPFTAFTL